MELQFHLLGTNQCLALTMTASKGFLESQASEKLGFCGIHHFCSVQVSAYAVYTDAEQMQTVPACH